MFFNYLPNCVGAEDQRYQDGTLEQRKVAESRFLHLIKTRLPGKVIIFTSFRRRSKYFPCWEAIPEMMQQFRGFKSGTYAVDGHMALTFFLRHPQGATKDLMRRAVKHILDIPNAERNEPVSGAVLRSQS